MNASIGLTISMPKDYEYFDSNEDCYAISEDQTTFVIADGASESFDSKSWARILSQTCIETFELNNSILDDAIIKYKRKFNIQNFSWSQQSAFDRGSYVSLLGIKLNFLLCSCELISIGDCCAILVHEDLSYESFPYSDPLEFNQRPELISTNPQSNHFMKNLNSESKYKKVWLVKHGDTILMTTDALGQWALKKNQDGQPNLLKLRGEHNQKEFEALINFAREQNDIRLDDTTLIQIRLCEP